MFSFLRLVHMGQRPTSEAKPNEQDALGFAAGLGEYGEVTYTNSPDCLLNRSSFRSFGYASLVRTLPSLSRKGAALDPPGGLVPLDSHARIRSLIMRCAVLFSFLFL